MIFVETDSDPTEWLLLPAQWNSESERDDWAQGSAEMLWRAHGRRPKRRERKSLAVRLSQIAEGLPKALFAHHIFLYMPDPLRMPVVLYAVKIPIEGDRSSRQREGCRADETTIQSAEVEKFSTERLGAGLSSLCYWTSSDGDLMASRNYAWRCEEFGIDLWLRSVSVDPGWLTANVDEMDDFARGIWLNPNATPDL